LKTNKYFYILIIGLYIMASISLFNIQREIKIDIHVIMEEDMDQFRNQVLLYAYKSIGVPYQYGMDDLALGVDCSGFVRLVLQHFQLIPPGDYSAQTLYDHFTGGKKIVDEIQPACLLFFGKSNKQISHVGLAIDKDRMLEAAGGTSDTASLGVAIIKNAFVRVSEIGRRYDLVAIADPCKR
jgi:cell wall-associated NlpC family hydrolase